jgi:beta-fructofuranosidase
MLRLPDRQILHGRIVDDGTEFHLFFVNTPHESKQRDTSIGHAVSGDLRVWRMLPDAIAPFDGPAWDDLGAGTGTALRGPDGRWRLFYSGVSRGEAGLVQRIGVARSSDLVAWSRAAEPLLSADPSWYEKLDLIGWPEEVWRDPFVFADPAGSGFHMLITARAASGAAADRGVVGHARSDDLDTWEILPPLTDPAGFGQLDAPQSSIVDGQPLLIFSCTAAMLSPQRSGHPGVWVAPGDSRLGPWDVSSAVPVDRPGLHAAQLVRNHDGQWMVMGTLDGGIADPVAVRYGESGLEVLPAGIGPWDA